MAIARSWLDLYLEYTRELESPTIYNKWVGVAVLGHAMGRRVWMPRGGRFPLFGAQVMLCLVGGSGIVKKTTAMNAGIDLFTGLPPGYGLTNVLPSRLSAQRLVRAMTPEDEAGMPFATRELVPGADGELIEIEVPADAVALIAAPELGSFFSKESFNETLATHIVPLNDAPFGLYEPETMSFGPRTYSVKYMSWEHTLRNPCIGMIACTTESGIAKELPEQMLQGGFFGRTIWVWANETDRELNPLVSMNGAREVGDVQTRLVAGLDWATWIRGPMLLTPEAEERFTTWYRSRERRDELLAKDDGLQTGYWPRKDSHILRTAMILNVADLVGRDPAWVAWRTKHKTELPDPLRALPPIQWAHIETAMAWLRELEPGRELCTREMGRSKKSQLPSKILRMLERRQRDGGWAKRLLIIRRMHRGAGANAEEIDRTLKLLLEAHEVRRRGEGKMTEWKRRREAGPAGVEEAGASELADEEEGEG